MDIIALDKEYVSPTYGRFPVELVSGKGSIMTGSDGKEYIDMGSGIGVTSFGTADEKWLEAVIRTPYLLMQWKLTKHFQFLWATRLNPAVSLLKRTLSS